MTMEKAPVDRENLAEIRTAIEPAEHKERVRPGDIVSHYGFRNRNGAEGTLTVWHNLDVGAIQFGKGSFWGKWRADRYTLQLAPNDGGEEFDLAGDVVEKGETEN